MQTETPQNDSDRSAVAESGRPVQRDDGKSALLPLVAVVLSVIALLATLFGFYRTDVSQEMTSGRVDTKVDAFSSRFEDVRSTVQQLDQQLDGLTEKFTGLSSDVSERISALSNTVGENESRFKTSLEESLSTVKSTVQDTVSSSRGKVDDVVGELRTAVNSKVDSLNAEIASVRSEVTESLSAARQENTQALDAFRGESLAVIESKQSENASALSALQGKVDNLSSSVEATAQQLNESLGTWQMQEVEHLLAMANQRLQLAGDVAIAETALGLAEQRLAEIGDPKTIDLRERITNDLKAIKAVPKVDVEGLALRVRAVADTVDDLPLAIVVKPAAVSENDSAAGGDEAQAEAGAEQDGSWLGSVTSTMKSVGEEISGDLSNLIKIREVQGSLKPLLTPEEEYFLRQNLRLKLQSSQLGLLRGDQDTYSSNLESGSAWLSEYFNTDDASVTSAAQELSELAAQSIAPDVPDISASVTAIRDFNQQRAKQ